MLQFVDRPEILTYYPAVNKIKNQKLNIKIKE